MKAPFARIGLPRSDFCAALDCKMSNCACIAPASSAVGFDTSATYKTFWVVWALNRGNLPMMQHTMGLTKRDASGVLLA